MDLNKSIQMESSSDEDSNDDFELMMTAAMLLHEHNSRPVRRGSIKGRVANVKLNQKKGHYQPYWDYFHPTKPIYDALPLARSSLLDLATGLPAPEKAGDWWGSFGTRGNPWMAILTTVEMTRLGRLFPALRRRQCPSTTPPFNVSK
jgi:hypothetical protein